MPLAYDCCGAAHRLLVPVALQHASRECQCPASSAFHQALRAPSAASCRRLRTAAHSTAVARVAIHRPQIHASPRTAPCALRCCMVCYCSAACFLLLWATSAMHVASAMAPPPHLLMHLPLCVLPLHCCVAALCCCIGASRAHVAAAGVADALLYVAPFAPSRCTSRHSRRHSPSWQLVRRQLDGRWNAACMRMRGRERACLRLSTFSLPPQQNRGGSNREHLT